MKYFLTLVTLVVAAQLSAARYHVVPNASASADGSSWATATTLHKAVSLAVAGDEIFVAVGNYLTTSDNNRHAAFQVNAGVSLFGGFLGHETSAAQRPMNGARTVLSGNIGAPHASEDNSYTVITLKSASNLSSTLDNFEIRDGMGRSFTEGNKPRSVGGGLIVEAEANGQSTHHIINCLFTNNQAHNGGAVFINGASPVFTNCTFASNQADFNGGAVYTNANATEASPVFRNCIFRDNKSNSGAGMTNNGINGNASPLLISCQFVNNFSLINNAAICNLTGESGEAEPVIDRCSFIGNDSILSQDGSTNGIANGKRHVPANSGGGTLRPVSARRK